MVVKPFLLKSYTIWILNHGLSFHVSFIIILPGLSGGSGQFTGGLCWVYCLDLESQPLISVGVFPLTQVCYLSLSRMS